MITNTHKLNIEHTVHVQQKETIIVDNGSGHVKAGLSGAEAPSCVFPAVVGRRATSVDLPQPFPEARTHPSSKSDPPPREASRRRPKHDVMMPGSDKREYFMGEEAMSKKGILAISYPAPRQSYPVICFLVLAKIFELGF